MKQTLIVDELPMNLNVYRNCHYYKSNNEKIKWEHKMKALVEEQDIKPVKRAVVRFTFYFKGKRRRDPDNYAACAKFIFDGLVKANILQDDNFDFIPSFIVKFGGYLQKRESYIKIDLVGE
jgi:Holliday junction resolvase RusA-like endonuclease